MTDATQRRRRNRTLVGCGVGCSLISLCVLLLLWFLGKQALALLMTGEHFAKAVAAGDAHAAWGLVEPGLQKTVTEKDLATDLSWLQKELGLPIATKLTGQRVDPDSSCTVLVFSLAGPKGSGGVEVSINPNNRPFLVDGWKLSPVPPARTKPAPKAVSKGKP
ncbi:MAG: hypothetical protein HYU66_12005 [Armatimonadetes bacterium]|nr:hypothetical protein [Armatimonadota bacterium]